MGHLGSRVSALLDGRLSAEEEERAWAHVHACHPCRDLVEREGWVKTRLAGLSGADRGAPAHLKSSLLGGSPSPLQPDRLTGTGSAPGSALSSALGSSLGSPTTWHRGLLAIGGSAAGAAVVGVLVLGAASGGSNLERRAPVSELNRPTPTTTLDRTGPPVRRKDTRGARDLVVRDKMDW